MCVGLLSKVLALIEKDLIVFGDPEQIMIQHIFLLVWIENI